MKQFINEYIEQLTAKHRTRRKLMTFQLEDYVKKGYKDPHRFQDAGGYLAFYQGVQELVALGRMQAIKQAKSNGRDPELRTAYWVVPEAVDSQWSYMDMVKLSDRLQLQMYMDHPEWQSVEEWKRIESIYRFLQERDQRDWVTREERSLELFGEEKWLSSLGHGAQMLRRLGLTLQDLKAKVYGEPFVYWPRPGARLEQADKLLIVENLSCFHTCRLAIERDGEVLGLRIIKETNRKKISCARKSPCKKHPSYN